MHFRIFIPALALLASLVSAQDSDTPIVDAFLDYMEHEGLSSLQAEGLTAQAALYSSLVDSIQGVLATAAPSDASFVESYVSSAVFADPTLSSVIVSITSEYGGEDATPAATGSDSTVTQTGSSGSGGEASSAAASTDSAHAVDARYMGLASTAVGAVVLGFAVFL